MMYSLIKRINKVKLRSNKEIKFMIILYSIYNRKNMISNRNKINKINNKIILIKIEILIYNRDKSINSNKML